MSEVLHTPWWGPALRDAGERGLHLDRDTHDLIVDGGYLMRMQEMFAYDEPLYDTSGKPVRLPMLLEVVSYNDSRMDPEIEAYYHYCGAPAVIADVTIEQHELVDKHWGYDNAQIVPYWDFIPVFDGEADRVIAGGEQYGSALVESGLEELDAVIDNIQWGEVDIQAAWAWVRRPEMLDEVTHRNIAEALENQDIGADYLNFLTDVWDTFERNGGFELIHNFPRIQECIDPDALGMVRRWHHHQRSARAEFARCTPKKRLIRDPYWRTYS